MNCPFCKVELKFKTTVDDFKVGHCLNNQCLNDGMPRFEIHYFGNKLIEKAFMIDNYYIQIYFDINTTVISKLFSYTIIDSITIYSIIEINMDNPRLSLPKIKKIMILS